MKKLTLLSLLAIATLAISSCGKKGCTDQHAPNYNSSATKDDGTCTDLTANIVGTYTGITTDSSLTDPNIFPTSDNEQIEVTKIDDSHIKISAVGNGSVPTITASVTSAVSGFYGFVIPSQTWSGSTISAASLLNNGYQYTSRTLTLSVYVDNADVISFTGTH